MIMGLRLKLVLPMVFIAIALLLGRVAVKQTTKPSEASAQSSSVPALCGQKLANYMNAIISGAGNLTGIRLTSPVFNLTNPREFQIYQAMNSAGANWSGLDAFAGNTYRLQGNSPYFYYANNPNAAWRSSFAGKPIIFTEYGNADQRNGAGNQNVLVMANDYNEAAADGSVLGINYFNALGGGGTEWQSYQILSDEFKNITANYPDKSGVNSATRVNASFAGFLRSYSSTARWSVEIIYNDTDREAARQAVQNALNLGITPVLRLCDKDSGCGFKDPNTLVDFLQNLNNSVPSGRFVYVVAGPNEPATELWLAPECGEGDVEPKTPFGIYDIPCDATYENPGAGRPRLNDGREFHSLRPYPASPCNPEQTDLALMCGNDLIAKQVYEVYPDDPNAQCDPPAADGSQLCRYTITDATVNVRINLDEAELPIVGNTEDVPNAVSANSNGLSFAQRVNEYVSWYLNGTTGRAEEADEIIRDTTPANEIAEKVNEIINFSGPIKKLLPFAIQNGAFTMLAGGSLLNPILIPVPLPDQPGLRGNQQILANNTRHNQIAVCQFFSAFLSIPVRCYRGQEHYRTRITEIKPFLDISGITNPLFSFIPFSSTEDRVGNISQAPIVFQPGTGSRDNPAESTIEVSNVRFVPAPGNPPDATQRLWFAHMQEGTELAEALQKTFLPQGEKGDDEGFSDVPNQLATPFCEIVTARTNPGDDLYGEYNRAPDNQKIPFGGTITYDGSFSCLFLPLTTDPICLANCDPATEDCSRCTEKRKPCVKNALIAMSVRVNTPLADELWNRLVGGTWSVFRRMFPQIGPKAPIKKLEDLPAYTNALYSVEQVSNQPGLIDTEALAGDPGLSRPGEQAKLFFPHLGGIHEYFLRQIQEALRPFGFGGRSPTTGEPPPIGGTGTCRTGTGYCSVENLLPFFDNDITKATNASQICNRESGGHPFSINKSCENGSTLDYSVGLFQINLLIDERCPNYNNSPIINYTTDPVSCTVIDEDRLRECVEYFLNPDNNIRWAVSNSANGTNWNIWAASRVCGLYRP